MLEADLINTGIKTIAMLFIVLGFLVLALILMKKYLLPKQKVKGDIIIKVLSSLHISPKERIEVIEVSGKRIVLGITPGRINFLTKLDELNQGKNVSGKEDEIKE
ncbi:MAG: flagellar biosynthetic protein FliO [Deltaproteobacteria bacterium]|nr:flagellar biosynthetic protein FliO [Deltaproteobacteria bacterium]MBW2088210.1 flagellar biosynthetic protein FliO [Deltaproteobacteria bacterium]MBW2320882.1 flagellar biosynthetic protein FliO [Deltaproteobacteria bacterium]